MLEPYIFQRTKGIIQENENNFQQFCNYAGIHPYAKATGLST